MREVCLCVYIYIYIYIFTVYIAAAQKHRACNRPGRPFCDKACNRIGGLATNPPCDKPIEDCNTLHRCSPQRFVAEGPQQRFVTEGGGTATNPYFEPHPNVFKNHDDAERMALGPSGAPAVPPIGNGCAHSVVVSY